MLGAQIFKITNHKKTLESKKPRFISTFEYKKIPEKQMPANFKTACDLRARSGGFDSHAVPPNVNIIAF
ncbi:hypothetical protein CU633_02675 [Bacillus sp. V3-13]|nr:hypothetical protein CU633_02675 [Bacillus sp. V3-13]